MLYSVTVFHFIIEVVKCANSTSCDAPKFSSGMVYVVTTLEGLVSALVVARLTMTSPSNDPSNVTSLTNASLSKKAKILIRAYLLVWLLTGLLALIFGTMIYSTIDSTLSDIGTTWLGLAVSATYAYFGLQPPTDPAAQTNQPPPANPAAQTNQG